MGRKQSLLLNPLMRKATLRRWKGIAGYAETAPLESLPRIRSAASELQVEVERARSTAAGRLAFSLASEYDVDAPLHSDWRYRPELWRKPIVPSGMASIGNEISFGGEIKVFHNCPERELIVRQKRNLREDDLAPFGLSVEVFAFEGSFMSLAIQLPDDALVGLERRHLVRMKTRLSYENPIEIFARLNIRHGPNVEQLVREFPFGDEQVEIDFDLAYSNMNEKRVESAWIDLILESPRMNMVHLRDVSFSRRPRADV